MAKEPVRDTENLASFEPNSGRGLPKATIREMKKLAAEREAAARAPAKKKATQR